MTDEVKTTNFAAEYRPRGLTLVGRDLILKPHGPVRYSTSFPDKPTHQLLTDAAECGFTFWGNAQGVGCTWATDDQQRFHAVLSGTRAGQRQSRHACGLMREALDKELTRLRTTAFWSLKSSERLDGYRELEITRLELSLALPTWRCDVNSPIIVHPPTTAAAVEALYLFEETCNV